MEERSVATSVLSWLQHPLQIC